LSSQDTIAKIDLGSLDTPETIRALDRACAEWGFFYLVGHDIDVRQRDEILAATRAFFLQPTEVKNRIRRTDSNSWGFYDAELTKNRRDWKEILDIGPAASSGPLAGSTPQWPDIEGFRDVIEPLTGELHEISLELVGAIARALESHEDVLAPFADHSSYIRLNYYPECDQPAAADSDFVPDSGHLGISHHTDAGAVTVLMQDDVAGLQVYNRGEFKTIEPHRDSLVINVGDIVQVWSNDRYRAPLHRVLASTDSPRLSIPYFLNPSYDYDYAPLAGVVNDSRPAVYRPINWGEFRSRRSAGDYADFGEEVQISHYRVNALSS
jgi:isopenicillin N synthase-like dioxygenase